MPSNFLSDKNNKKSKLSKAAKQTNQMSDFITDIDKDPIDDNYNYTISGNNLPPLHIGKLATIRNFFVSKFSKDNSNKEVSSNSKINAIKGLRDYLNIKSDKSLSSSTLPSIFNGGNNTKKITSWFFIIAIPFIFYFFPFWKNTQPKLYLSNTSSSFADLAKQEQEEASTILDMGDPIYVYFSMGKKINAKEIEFEILDVSNQDSVTEIGKVRYTVNSKWTKVQTQFQEEYFDRQGEYRIRVSIPGAEPIIEKDFSIH